MHSEKATKEYINAHFKIQEEIKKLQKALDTHNQEVTHINWGHVGDMKRVLAQLKQLNGEE